MSRTARLLLENVCYHIITRGNQRQSVFTKDEDFMRYLDILKRCKKRFKVCLYAYCLMSNHVHLILEANPSETLSKTMQSINQSYTRYFNHAYKKSGHLWQGRFQSLIINKDRYLFDCINYIESNPVRAKIVTSPLVYQWSSYTARTLGINDSLLDTLKV